MFALWIPVAAVRAAMAFGVAEQLGLQREGRASIDSFDDIARLVGAQQALAFVRVIDLLAFIAMGVVFIVWTHRVYRNLVRLGAPHRHGTGWAIGSWVTPIVNLWWPKQVLVDMWRGSAPAGGPPDERSDLLGAWWSVYIASSVVGLLFANDESPAGFVAEGVRRVADADRGHPRLLGRHECDRTTGGFRPARGLTTATVGGRRVWRTRPTRGCST